MIYAPVLIPTLCRFEHLHRCVASLQNCTGASETVLYIALDYPSSESHWEGYRKILHYLENLDGFKRVILIKREYNFGARQNAVDAKMQVYKDFDRVIFSEDDNEFAPNFLEYVNAGLEKYQYNNDVHAVCGYNFPVDFSSYNHNVYFNWLYSAWGVGLWRNKAVSPSYDNIYSTLHSIKKMWRLFLHCPRLILSLMRMLENRVILGDLYISAMLVANKRYCLFPTVSKVRNWGHDGSGENSTTVAAEKYNTQKLDDSVNFEIESICKRRISNHNIDNYLDLSFFEKIKIPAKVLICLIKYKKFESR